MREIPDNFVIHIVKPNPVENRVRLGAAHLTISGSKLKDMKLTHLSDGRGKWPSFMRDKQAGAAQLVLPPGSAAGFSVITSDSQFALLALHIAAVDRTTPARIVVSTGQIIEKITRGLESYLTVPNSIFTVMNPYSESDIEMRSLNINCVAELA